MISVGYGDISPKTDAERIFSVFSMLFSCAVFGKNLFYLFSLKKKNFFFILS
jgi:uncharacterized membrane protein